MSKAWSEAPPFQWKRRTGLPTASLRADIACELWTAVLKVRSQRVADALQECQNRHDLPSSTST